ncbi:MAG TPA: hypothetical protein VML75_13295, partial [Kofleriaceae bacterium]|nr:hypothetical protein [Kofleriaceae bacterium]
MSARTLGALVACAAFAWSASAGAAPPCKNVKQCEAQCKRGIAPSCTRLGDLVGGEGPKVQALYQKACEGGDPGACRRAAMLEPDWRARRNPLMQACRAGDGIACLEVAKSARGRAAERFEEDARRLLTAACDAGEPSACDDAAALCKGGVGGPRDEACT